MDWASCLGPDSGVGGDGARRSWEMTGSEGLGGVWMDAGASRTREEAESRHFSCGLATWDQWPRGSHSNSQGLLPALWNGNSNTGHLIRAFGDFDEFMELFYIWWMVGMDTEVGRKELVRRWRHWSQERICVSERWRNETAERPNLYGRWGFVTKYNYS